MALAPQGPLRPATYLRRQSALIVCGGIIVWAVLSAAGHGLGASWLMSSLIVFILCLVIVVLSIGAIFRADPWIWIWQLCKHLRGRWISRAVSLRRKARANLWWITFAAGSTVTSGILILMTFDEGWKKVAVSLGFPSGWLAAVRDDRWLLWVLVLTPIFVAIFEKLGEALEVRERELSADLLSTLCVIRQKHAHEQTKLREIDLESGGNGASGHVTDRILDLIAESIHLAFTEISRSRDHDVKVVIFECLNDTISRPIAIQPSREELRSSLETIQDPGSSASFALKKRKLQILPDLRLEGARGPHLSRYKISPTNPDGASGSLLCFPVRRRKKGEILAIICIQSLAENSFIESERDFYTRELETYEADYIQAIMLKEINDEKVGSVPLTSSASENSRAV